MRDFGPWLAQIPVGRRWPEIGFMEWIMVGRLLPRFALFGSLLAVAALGGCYTYPYGYAPYGYYGAYGYYPGYVGTGVVVGGWGWGYRPGWGWGYGGGWGHGWGWHGRAWHGGSIGSHGGAGFAGGWRH
jgi:hypothetical protein